MPSYVSFNFFQIVIQRHWVIHNKVRIMFRKCEKENENEIQLTVAYLGKVEQGRKRDEESLKVFFNDVNVKKNCNFNDLTDSFYLLQGCATYLWIRHWLIWWRVSTYSPSTQNLQNLEIQFQNWQQFLLWTFIWRITFVSYIEHHFSLIPLNIKSNPPRTLKCYFFHHRLHNEKS